MTPPTILLFGKVGQVGWELRRTLAPLGRLVCVDYPDVDFTRPDSIRNWIRDVRVHGFSFQCFAFQSFRPSAFQLSHR